ncbi:MAG: hypothetical protein Q8O88_03830 [bacterium]|nr:hypothetical protein [bacterium]
MTTKKKKEKKLGEYEFRCDKCKKIHKMSAFAVAQIAMHVPLIFTCSCGNKIDL